MITKVPMLSNAGGYLKSYSLPMLAMVPLHFKLVAWIWFSLSALVSLGGVEEFAPKVFIPVAFFCYWVLLSRPMREVPFALLLLATGASEVLIYLGPLLFLGRSFITHKIYFPKKLYGYLFLLFLLPVSLSVLLSWITVEFRPLQSIFWCVTFLAPLAIGFLGFRISMNPEAVARYAIFLIVMQLIPVIAQLPIYLSGGSPDVITGTWMDADIVGFWATSLLMGSLLWYLRTGNASLWKICGFVGLGIIMTVLASGKIYSGCVLIAGLGMLILSLDSIRNMFLGKLRTVFFMVLLTVSIGFVSFQVYQYRNLIHVWAGYQLEHSQKVTFLDRVFFKMNDYGYNDLLGVGPGMLGSRAANSVSASVLAKPEKHMPEFLMNAPEPEVLVMKGLFSHKLLESIEWMSATLVFPFSGVAAVKGELGLIGVVLMFSLMMSRYWHDQYRYFGSLYLPIAYWMAACAGVATIGLSLFDTVWEMPKIMVFLNAIMLGMGRRKKVE